MAIEMHLQIVGIYFLVNLIKDVREIVFSWYLEHLCYGWFYIVLEIANRQHYMPTFHEKV